MVSRFMGPEAVITMPVRILIWPVVVGEEFVHALTGWMLGFRVDWWRAVPSPPRAIRFNAKPGRR